jgi:hypothetical protein
MRPDVAEYLTLAYKGELAIREAKQETVNRWAKDTAKLLVERLKKQLGAPDLPVYRSNMIGQVVEMKRSKTKIPPIIPKFISQLGGVFDANTFNYNIPPNVTFENAILGAKVLMERAFEFHMFPKALWGMAAILTGVLSLASAYVVYLRYDDWINVGILVGMIGLFVLCAFKTIRYQKFSDAAKIVRDRVIRSKSIPE